MPTPSDVPQVTSAATGTAADDATDAAPLVHVLTEESGSALADAQTVTDARLARLFASIGVARRLQAERLASSAGLEAPRLADADAAHRDPGRALGRSARPGDRLRGRHRAGLGGRRGAIVGCRPRGRGDPGGRPSRNARGPGPRSPAWPARGSTHGASRTDLPNAILDPAVDAAARDTALAGLEADLGALWLGLASTSAPGARAPLVDAFADAARTAADLSGTIPVLPGMPDIG